MKIDKKFNGQWFHERHFLNKPGHHSIAAIMAYIRIDNNWVDSELIITDCSERVSLDVSVYSAESRENTVHKLRLIADVCNKMADWVEGAGKDLFGEISSNK